MDHVKFRYMLELPNYLIVLIHLGLRENLFSRVNQQETIKFFCKKKKSKSNENSTNIYLQSIKTLQKMLDKQKFFVCTIIYLNKSEKMMISNKLQIGSSETTREILYTQLDFENYIRFGRPQHKSNPNLIFLEWFIGFFEAEGCFLKWPDQKQKNRFGVEITQKDVQLMYKIRTELGFGKVTEIVKKNNEIYWRYSVYDLKNLTRLIWLFNGNLITVKKQKQFQIWVTEFNKRYNSDILFSNTKPEICFENAWLSGFFEGDAGFWVKSKDIVRVNKDNSQSYSIKMKFYVTQRDEKELLNQIKHLFQIPSDIYQITNGSSTEKYNRLETSLLKSHLLLIQYLTKYPFLGKRQIIFNRWERVLGYRIKNYPITKKSIIKLQRLILNTK